MLVAIYDNEKDVIPKIPSDLSWDEMIELFTTEEAHRLTECAPCPRKSCQHKFGSAWSPVELMPGSNARDDKNIKAVTALVLDADDLTDEDLAVTKTVLTPFNYIIHSTHSHKPPSQQCIRIILELSKPVPSKQWRRFWASIVLKLNLPRVDRHCGNESRIYFLPSGPFGMPRIAFSNKGVSIDVDQVLTGVGSVDEQQKTPTAVSPESTDPTSSPLEYAEIRRLIKQQRFVYLKSEDKEKGHLLNRVLTGQALTVKGSRNATINRLMSILAFILPSNTLFDTLQELIRYSITAMDFSPEGVEYWFNTAKNCWDRAIVRQKEVSDASKAENLELARRLGFQIEPPTLSWTQRLIRKGVDPNGELKPCSLNTALILQHHPSTKDTFKFNEVLKSIEVTSGPFASCSPATLDVAVTNWLQETFKLTSLHSFDVGLQISYVARQNSYDPLSDYLSNLHWDNISRLDNILPMYFGANTVDIDGTDVTEHLRRIGPKWMIGAVARGLSPGEQVDNVWILEGQQGIQKTSGLRILGGPWFCETPIKLGDKDSMMLAARSWIIELAELKFNEKETESIKAFLTRRVDSLRPPYARAIEDFPRRAVFAGTLNRNQYLFDTTGNRRYWPFFCTQIDLDSLARDRNQLWSEAVHRYRKGEVWYLSKSEEKFAEERTAIRMTTDSIQDAIIEYWYGLKPPRPSQISVKDIAILGLHIPLERVSRSLETKIGNTMKDIMGFTKIRPYVNGIRTWMYAPTETLINAPQGKSSRQIALASKVPDVK